MRVAIIGAGIAGLTAARRLALAGHSCDVYERWPGLGGQVATLPLLDGDPLERYYHHLFTSDVDIVALYEELGIEDAVQWLPSSVAMFARGELYPFTTPFDLLRFSAMPLASRLRMGLAVLDLKLRHKRVEPFESLTAREWIERRMGPNAWTHVWGPLLAGKFGERADQISMGWLWSKLTVRRQVRGKEVSGERLGYPRGGWQPLLDRLAAEIEGHGGRVLIDQPAAAIELNSAGALAVAPAIADSFRRGHDPRRFERAGPARDYDSVVATVPSDVFLQLLSPALEARIGDVYLSRVAGAEYHAAVCLLLELDRRFSPFYWTNIADRRVPFIGLIEHTNLIDPARYGGRRFLYVANYVARDDPLLDVEADELLDLYEPGLRLVNPDWQRAWVRERWLFREPAAQPIVTVGYRERIPPMQTPAPGLYLANTTQIYPEDRGTNYSVRLGEQVAALASARTSALGAPVAGQLASTDS